MIRLYWWVLIQYGWCPFKMGKFGDRHMQEEYHVNMKAEMG